MRPRFPVLRATLTSLLLALLVAAGVGAVARLTLPSAEAGDDGVTRPASPAVLGQPTGEAEAPSAASADSDTSATAASADGSTAAAGAPDATAAADSAGASAADSTQADSTQADSTRADSTQAAAAGTTQGSATRGASPFSTVQWPTSLDEVIAAPERNLVLAAFGLSFLASMIAAAIAVAGSAPKVVEEGPVRRRSDAVQLLALFQREGRLVDFLQEEIEPYSDAQVGAAVRAVHSGCRKALADHLEVIPVMTEDEGQQVTIAKGFDPSAVRVTGNVSGDPPFTGALRHRGWRAASIDLPTDARGQDPEVVVPAEIEVS